MVRVNSRPSLSRTMYSHEPKRSNESAKPSVLWTLAGKFSLSVPLRLRTWLTNEVRLVRFGLEITSIQAFVKNVVD